MQKWTSSAPRQLIQLCESRKSFPGRTLLVRLLCDENLVTTWSELSRHITAEAYWRRVWASIAHATHQSNQAEKRFKSRADERDELLALARSIASLVKKIEPTPAGRLEIHALFPADVLAALNVVDAAPLLQAWPTTTELLQELAERADALADDAMKRPRAVQRQRGGVRERTFIWHLADDFKNLFGAPLLGSVAAIAASTFPESEREINKSFVQSVLRGV